MNNGLVHLYIGEGKGKTTAALGLALRCYGCGNKALVLQFLKTWDSGEVDAIRNIDSPSFRLIRFESEHDLVFDDPTALEFEYLKKDIQKAYVYALDAAVSGKWDLIVLDEILWAHHFSFVSLDELIKLVSCKNKSTELVLTGRFAPDELTQLADYITYMEAVRHPYERGIDARKGIEF